MPISPSNVRNPFATEHFMYRKGAHDRGVRWFNNSLGRTWRRLAALVALLCLPFVGRGDETCATCTQTVEVTGQFSHVRIGDEQTIQGAMADDEAPFREEIVGKNFAVTVPHLPAGKYTIVIGVTEAYFKEPDRRLFDVTYGHDLIISNLDIFAVTGGARRALYLTNEIEHSDDSIGGPLTLNFTARKDQAKFNTFEIKDASGTTLVATKATDLADPLEAAASKIPVVNGPELWKDSTQPVDVRVQDLISRLSLAEKVHQIRNDTPAISRLGIPAYDFWSEALHGVARNGIATVFPQAIGMAATWDTALIHQEGDVISTEGRAKHNEYVRTHNGNSANCSGLTFWSPNINIFRDPRWGRGQETYGEDTFLTSRIGVAFIKGLQGEDTNYVKAMACAKHFAVHSGPESKRHRFDAEPPERDFYETYLPHFEAAVREGHVDGFMGAYNSVFGKPACASDLLLTDLLRKQWGFTGYIVSDCGAIEDIDAHHKYVATPEAAAAAAVKAGCDICCGGDFNALLKAVRNGLITEPEINGALAYALKARFQLGLFDPADKVPFANIPMSENDTPEHQELALRAARESVVLLKNNGLLPLDRNRIKRIAVIGANADSTSMLLGNYNGDPSHPISILDGIRTVAGTNIEVTFQTGCPLAVTKDGTNRPSEQMQSDALTAAQNADVVIYVGGISPEFEGEEFGGVSRYDGFTGGDRSRIELPPVQESLIQSLVATGKPVVFVNCSGSAVAMPWEASHLPAILQAWYPGEQGGRAVAEVLFGDVNPAGRLPVTFYRSTTDLPDFEDYGMSNRTYRYFNGKPLFAFGHGLSYTRFHYSSGMIDTPRFNASAIVKVSFDVNNSGKWDGDEVAQVYFRHIHSAVPQPKLALCGFARVHLTQGGTTHITIDIPAERFRYWDTTQKQYVVESGDYELLIGAASDDIRLHVPFKVDSTVLADSGSSKKRRF